MTLTHKLIVIAASVVLTLIASVTFGQSAGSIPPGPLYPRPLIRPVYYQAYPSPQSPAPAARPAAVAPPMLAPVVAPAPGFEARTLAAVNAFRAQFRLAPLAPDPRLAADAATNNALQRARGIGHWYAPGYWQVAGWNYRTPESLVRAWANSPGHNAAMRSPTRLAGVAFDGVYSTMNMR